MTPADAAQAVLAAAKAARPELAVEAAEHEVRDGRHYYDVGGRLPDGSELELDIMETNGGWTVVEIQRDIVFDDAPAPVRNIMAEERGDFTPTRVIESDQGDGVVIYELFGPGPDGDDVKIEVKFEDGAAALLTEEWAH